MLDLNENRRVIEEFNKRLLDIFNSLNLKEKKKELIILENKTLNENFWNDLSLANPIIENIKEIKNKLKTFEDIESDILELKDINSLLDIEFDSELEDEWFKLRKDIKSKIEKFAIQALLSEKYDECNAIVTIHPGAGGTESQDWAEMLYRMYSKWANNSNFELKELDLQDGDEAGIKSVTIVIKGKYSYGYLKGENGVHRLVRISPFDAGGRRHTSFASVEVLPEISGEVNIEINANDLRIDTYRSSGAGGQHINKTESAIRITHIPTGIVTTCQSERSQTMNKETAMKTLKSKLICLKEKENKEKIEDLKGVQKEIAWGSQIRSYVFCPYTLVKDHRTNFEVGNAEAVMNGEIDEFITEYLKSCIR